MKKLETQFPSLINLHLETSTDIVHHQRRWCLLTLNNSVDSLVCGVIDSWFASPGSYNTLKMFLLHRNAADYRRVVLLLSAPGLKHKQPHAQEASGVQQTQRKQRAAIELRLLIAGAQTPGPPEQSDVEGSKMLSEEGSRPGSSTIPFLQGR